jgi:hypothetical protein
MNEIKRQLNQKMGDTKERTERIMMNVGQKKQQLPLKKKSSLIYYVAFSSFVALLGLFFFLNPFSSNHLTPSLSPKVGTPEIQLEEPTLLNLKSIFKKDGDVAYFVGDFNEYATFTETTTWLNDEYVQILTDNGGSVTRQIYKVSLDKIELVFEKMDVSESEDLPIEKLELLKPISTLLIAPIEDGAAFDDKVITYPVDFLTPYKKFSDTIQVTVEDQNSTIDYYYAQHYGLIGKITTFEDDYQITSMLTSINDESTTDTESVLPVFNKTTNELEAFPLQEFSLLLDPLFIYKPGFKSEDVTYEVIHNGSDKELGIVEINTEQNYITAIVTRSNETFEVIGGSYSKIADWKYSPNKQLIAFLYSSNSEIENESITYDPLHVLDLNDMRFTTLYLDSDFPISGTPILSYTWLDNVTIEYVIPDVDYPDSTLLLQWQQSDEKPTKSIIRTLK